MVGWRYYAGHWKGLFFWLELPKLPVFCCDYIDAKEKVSNTVGEYSDEQTSCVIEDQTIWQTCHNASQP